MAKVINNERIREKTYSAYLYFENGRPVIDWGIEGNIPNINESNGLNDALMQRIIEATRYTFEKGRYLGRQIKSIEIKVEI